MLIRYEPPPLPAPPSAGGGDLPVAHRAWSAARGRVLDAVATEGEVVLLLGAAGTGKSLLLRELARLFGAAGYEAVVVPPGDAPFDRAAEGKRGAKARAPLIVLVDGADGLDEDALGRLGLLEARNYVFAATTVAGGPLVRLFSRAAVVHLEGLRPDEVGAFAASRLAAVRRPAAALEAGAGRRLAELSGGLPRAVDRLARAAAFLAAADGDGRVRASHVERAAAMRAGGADPGEARAASDAAGVDPVDRLTEGVAARAGGGGASPACAAAGSPVVGRPRTAALALGALTAVLCVTAGVHLSGASGHPGWPDGPSAGGCPAPRATAAPAPSVPDAAAPASPSAASGTPGPTVLGASDPVASPVPRSASPPVPGLALLRRRARSHLERPAHPPVPHGPPPGG